MHAAPLSATARCDLRPTCVSIAAYTHARAAHVCNERLKATASADATQYITAVSARAANHTRARDVSKNARVLADRPPPLDSPHLESKARSGALLPQRAHDASPQTERACAAAVFALALAVRLYRIAEPAAVVFDEVHFLRFVKNYRDGEYLFDIHPPLGKLVLLAVSNVFCRPPVESLTRIGMRFPRTYDYVPLRAASALFGAATAPVLLLIARALGLALPAALLPALAF
eukprot:IDg20794t1